MTEEGWTASQVKDRMRFYAFGKDHETVNPGWADIFIF
jgi:hypothetical protein